MATKQRNPSSFFPFLYTTYGGSFSTCTPETVSRWIFLLALWSQAKAWMCLPLFIGLTQHWEFFFLYFRIFIDCVCRCAATAT